MSLPAASPTGLVLVTGASSGIGESLARELASRGHNLALVARREDRLLGLAAALRDQHGVEVDVHAVDVGDAAAREALVEALLAGSRAVVGVCNNAGFGAVGRGIDVARERQVQMVRVNVEAVLDLTRAFLPAMVARGEGAILNLASVAAAQPMPGFATYAASKAFVASYSEATHAELGGTGVSVTALSPGPVRTEFGERAGAAEMNAGPSALYVDAAEVARQGVVGMEEGRRTVTPGLANKVGAIGGRLAPRSALLPLVRALGAKRAA